MNTNERQSVEDCAHPCIGAAFEVSDELGAGFLEKVYENALVHEQRLRGLFVEQQKKMLVRYKTAVVGNDVADLLVEQQLLVELKCVETLADEHLAQCLNDLKGAGLSLCLPFNFHKPKVEFRRIVLNH